MGISKIELHRRYSIPRGTLQNWESGRHPLTEKGAQRLVNAASAEGVKVTSQWLIDGKGSKPTSTHLKNEDLGSISIPEPIQNEINFFLSNNSIGITHLISDDHMAPLFLKGHVVAGIRMYGDNINSLHMRHCIIQTKEYGILVRTLKVTERPLHFHLLSLNNEISGTTELQYIDVISAAPILWHRKNLTI